MGQQGLGDPDGREAAWEPGTSPKGLRKARGGAVGWLILSPVVVSGGKEEAREQSLDGEEILAIL